MRKPKIAIVLLVVLAGLAQADTITVCWDGSGDYTTIQAGIDAAVDGDEVAVCEGTYTGNGNRDLDFGGKAITVRSTDPNDSAVVATTVIDCQGAGRGFCFHSGEEPNSIVAGFNITNGYHYNMGGGIYCYKSSPTIQNNIIEGCCALFYGWEIPGVGGGIYCRNSSAVITDNIITENWVEGGGGGIFSSVSSLILINNIITANEAYGYAGFFPGAGWGGGISCVQSSLMITNNTISGNRTYDTEFPWTFPGGEGGGIYCSSSYLTLVNGILWGDSPDEVFNYKSTIKISYSDIQGGWPGTGNINANPRFASTADYHLQSAAGRWDPVSKSWVQDGVTSPCIDAGNPGCPLGDEPNDANNIRINMGAYGGTAEASKSPADWALLADLTNDLIVDFNDLDVFVNYWLNSGVCIPSDLNRNQSVNFNDFTILADDWLENNNP